ncbi:MAG: RagB/SusD family nutrient uptake outer membrane protein [Candidatus Symbiothrix sp.]|jgi:hypothetical protein|nr:RagB/SusD family nutrient uptake outer membrane protein [Candidatus Symbiothrix sp.]
MKNNKIKLFNILLALSFAFSACNDMLIEEAQSVLVPDFFTSEQGLEGELIGAYSGLRGLYGVGGNVGTDEFYTSDVVLGWEKSVDTYDALLDPANAGISSPWTSAFVYINSCNGVIQNGVDVDMDASRKTVMIAEAKFLRAQYYFALVQNYGATPLDLGSGKLAYNTNPSTLSERNSVAEVYDAIVSDLTESVEGLPIKPAQLGRGTKAAALHFLSKVYLTRATSVAAKSDDYTNAFQYANELIQNQASYGAGLQQDFGMVHAEGHERDAEVLFTVEYTHDYVFGGGHSSPWLFTAGYENCRVNGVTVVARSIRYQRPWRMYVTTPHLIFESFAEKKNDSRWDNSFRLMWECNTSALESVGLNVGDPGILLYFEGDDLSTYPDACVKYKIEDLFDANGFYKHSYVNYMYPTLVKFDDTQRTALNDMSYRPFTTARLGETYLIAAEALIMQGKKTEAAEYINVIRRRAAYRPSLSPNELAQAEAAMEIKDPNILDIDFILDERTRELCGEQSRWLELIRTHTLVERVKAHNPQGAPNVKPIHEIRPIPQSQIDLMSDPAQKAAYQNEGYK